MAFLLPSRSGVLELTEKTAEVAWRKWGSGQCVVQVSGYSVNVPTD